jgi:AraC-like DNA-binding protein
MLADVAGLHRHCLIHSTGFGDIKNAVSQHLWPHQMNMREGGALNSHLYGVFFGQAALLDLHYGAPVNIDAGDITDFYLIRVTLQGGGQISLGKQTARLHQGGVTVSSPSQRSTIHTDRDCRNLILRVERPALERQLQGLLGYALKQPLLFDIEVPEEHPGLAVVRSTLAYVCELHQQPLLASLAPGLSDYVMAVLLSHLPHNYSRALQSDQGRVLPRHVKRARDYIEQHLDEPIALATVAQVCEVSIRTLQNGFSQFLEQTPSEYLRARRLARVHEALQGAGDDASVTDILLDHGVSSFGHFAMQYRKQFGCLPSDTLRKRL